MKNFGYGAINERNFSNPHSWSQKIVAALVQLIGAGYFIKSV